MKRNLDKVAIVTGGSGGLGAATCERLIAEGATVVVAGRTIAKVQAVADQLGERAIGMHFDAEDEASIRKLIDDTYERFGRLDFLDNNAGLTARETGFQDRTAPETPPEVWDRMMTVNLRACFLACKYAIPHMIAGGGGSIVNISSASAVAGDANRIAYGTSKAGLIAMSKYVAAQHGRDGIRCNAVLPGLILVPAIEKGNPDLARTVKPHILGKRTGRAEDVAALVAYLASDESAYINGQAIQIDGGMTSAMPFLPTVLGENLRA